MELILAILVAGPVGFFTETRQRGLAIYLATINVDGTGQRRLTRTAALETNPVWSPDGRRIAFTSDRHAKRGPVHRQLGRTFELYKMRTDGRSIRRLTHNRVPDLQPLP
jgi:Tol biopolymer transport system component